MKRKQVEEERSPEGVRWKQLGPEGRTAPSYEPAPEGVHFYYAVTCIAAKENVKAGKA